jgi:hypothetical protein
LRGVGLLSLRALGDALLLQPPAAAAAAVTSVAQGLAQLTPHALLLLLVGLLLVGLPQAVLLLWGSCGTLVPCCWQPAPAQVLSLQVLLLQAVQLLPCAGPAAGSCSPALLQQLLRTQFTSQGCASSCWTVARCLGSFTSMRATQSFAAVLMPSQAGWSKSGSESSTAFIICRSVAPSKGSRPASMRKTTTPTDQTSASGP